MVDDGLIQVTGAAGKTGSFGRTVTTLLLDRGFPVRAMVRREDERAASLRAAGAQVVVGDLLEPGDVYRVVSGCGPGLSWRPSSRPAFSSQSASSSPSFSLESCRRRLSSTPFASSYQT